ncbi:hypothetical protein Pelo_14179 [Pelomyxa schiedti]|nr:hypothetical protein Pelo_14179 [Pelomyxa schiedti]
MATGSGHRSRKYRWANLASLIVGVTIAAGTAVVASFQSRDMPHIHFTAAGVTFVGLICYNFLACVLAKCTHKSTVEFVVLTTSLCCSVIGLLVVSVFIICGKVGLADAPLFKMIAAVGEWFMFISLAGVEFLFWCDLGNARVSIVLFWDDDRPSSVPLTAVEEQKL